MSGHGVLPGNPSLIRVAPQYLESRHRLHGESERPDGHFRQLVRVKKPTETARLVGLEVDHDGIARTIEGDDGIELHDAHAEDYSPIDRLAVSEGENGIQRREADSPDTQPVKSGGNAADLEGALVVRRRAK